MMRRPRITTLQPEPQRPLEERVERLEYDNRLQGWWCFVLTVAFFVVELIR